jgi:predicted RNA-binding Zn-ribbon protein involved in translation (DUF1610 family)
MPKTIENLECPKCGNDNIVPVGMYYQCQSKRVNGGTEHDYQGCGFLGPVEQFRKTEIVKDDKKQTLLGL